MKVEERIKKADGITLVALIITIIILIILAAVTINAVMQDGFINVAISGTQNYTEAQYKELDEISKLTEKINDALDKLNENEEESFVGYYADIDADGVVDGIIYADLAEEDHLWKAVKNTKEYYISQEAYEGECGTKPVISPLNTGNDRFYVMALSAKGSYCWYYGADTNADGWETVTSKEFGTGKTNTATMIAKWDSEEFGPRDASPLGYEDIWGQMQDEIENGWFVPSYYEYLVFGWLVGTEPGPMPNYYNSFLSSSLDSYDGYPYHMEMEGIPNLCPYSVKAFAKVLLSTTF